MISDEQLVKRRVRLTAGNKQCRNGNSWTSWTEITQKFFWESIYLFYKINITILLFSSQGT